MRKINFISVFLAVSILFCGCADKKDHVYEDKEWRTNIRSVSGIEPYEDGVYYKNKNDILCYFDTSSQKATVLCNKKGCSHEGKSCPAYIETFGMPDAANDSLYYLSLEGELTRKKLDNTSEEKIWDMGKTLRKEMGDETSISFSGYIVTGNYVYTVVRSAYTDEEGAYKEREELHVLDTAAKKQTVLETVDASKETLEILSAKNNITYYQAQNAYDKDFQPETATEEEWKEQEKKMNTRVCRADAKNGGKEQVFELKSGFVSAATDDIGIYYNDFLGTGYMETKNLCRKDRKTGEETILKKGDITAKYMYTILDAEHIVVQNEKGLGEIYNMKEFEMEAVVAQKEYWVAYPVKGGYFCYAPENEDGMVWQYFTEKEIQKEGGNAVMVKE